MKIKKGDTVVVTAGKDKGKTGKVLKVFPATNQVVVEKVNMQTKFRKKSHQGPGEMTKREGKLDASNVMYIDEKTKKRTRIGYKKLENGKKVRVTKKSNAEIN